MGCKIDKDLLQIKVLYFLSLAGLGSLMPYMGIYMKHIGLNATETALISGVMPMIGAPCKLIAGLIADKLQKYRECIGIISVLTAGFHLAILLIQPAAHTSAIDLSCSESHVKLDLNSNTNGMYDNDNCSLACKRSADDPLNSSIVEYVSLNLVSVQQSFIHNVSHNASCHSSSWMYQCSGICSKLGVVPSIREPFSVPFFSLFFIFLAGQVFFSPVISLIDAVAFDILGENRKRWGRQRMWGTIGFACCGLGVSLFMTLLSSATLDWTPGFISFAAAHFLMVIPSYFVRQPERSHGISLVKGFTDVCCNKILLPVFFLVTIMGGLWGVLETFLFWHLSSLGGSQLLMGLCLMCNSLFEIPLLFVSKNIIKKIGYNNSMILSGFAYAIRFFTYAFLKNPWFVLLVEPLHGAVFGLFYSAVAAFCSLHTPEGLHGTAQGVIAALHFCVGKGLGSILGGIVIQSYSFFHLAIGCGVLVIFSIILFTIITTFIGNKHDRREPVNIDEPNEANEVMLDNIK